MRVLKLPSILMHPQAKTCRDAWVAALRAAPTGTCWTLDASDLTEFDSSALAVLLACRREAMALGQSLVLTGLPAKLQALAGLYGVMPLLSA